MPRSEISHFKNLPQPIKNLGLILLTSFVVFGCGGHVEQSRVADGAAFGRAIDALDSHAIIGAAYEQHDSAQGAAYIYRYQHNSWSVEQRLVSPQASQELFGSAVAIGSDYVAVGAPTADLFGVPSSGKVYIYQKLNAQWTHITTLTSPAPSQAFENFGGVLAIDNDTLIVSASGRDVGFRKNAGLVFVYQKNGSNFSLISTVSADAPRTNDRFGQQLAIDGNRLAVSSPGHDIIGRLSAGAVYAFERSGNNFSFSQKISANDFSSGDNFGSSLAIQHASGDNYKLVVGAPKADLPNAVNAGAAYVFKSSNGQLFTQSAKLNAASPSAENKFATSLALKSDQIFVGAIGNNGTDIGALHTFQHDGNLWLQIQKIVPANLGQSVSRYGVSIAALDDQLLLGADGLDLNIGIENAGGVQALRQDDQGLWSPAQLITAAGSSLGDGFTRQLAADGGRLAITGDPHSSLFREDEAGLSLEAVFPSEPNSSIRAVSLAGGTAAVFGKRNSTTLPIGYLTIFSFQQNKWQQSGLYNPDLVSNSFPRESASGANLSASDSTIVLGAQRWNGGDGRVFIYQKRLGMWSLSQTMTSPYAANNFDRNFGQVVALSGDWLAVSEVPSSGSDKMLRYGNVYIYHRLNGQFIEQQVISEPIPTSYDYFGNAVALHNDLLAAYGRKNEILRVYQRNNGVYTQVWQQHLADAGAIAINDMKLVVGNPKADFNGLTDAGEILTFDRQSDNSFLPGQTFRVENPHDNLKLGYELTLDNSNIYSAGAGTSHNARVYKFSF